ncbi:STAS domain-containing protein [Tumidithrix helvetica PCC 7403]|uniref:STAS domain-containing protein n=1 Tax=Tumidithrix helvetica TaxID=3457545 RepID=UPI003CA6C542
MTLKISTKLSEPTTSYLVLDGKLDAITAPELEEFIDNHLSPEIATLILDLQALSFVSSAGLRIFAKLRKMMKSRDGKAFFVNLSPQVKKVFDIVKAVPIAEVFQDIEELDAYLANMQRRGTEEHE